MHLQVTDLYSGVTHSLGSGRLLTLGLAFLLLPGWVTSAKAYEIDWLCDYPVDGKATALSLPCQKRQGTAVVGPAE